MYTSPSVNDQLNSFNNIYETVLENHAPIKNIKIKSRPTPFVDDEIKLAMKERDQLHEQFSQTRCPLDWLNYKKARNTVKFKLRSSEKDYIADQISKCKKNSGALWKIIHQTLPKKERSKPVYTKDNTKVADDFNTYFATVGKNTAQAVKKLSEDNNIQPYINSPYLSNPAFRCPDAFKFVAVSEDEILRTIMSIPINKFPGPDKINMRIIRDSLPYILTPVTNIIIINSSLLSSTYPDSWKLAEVVPIPKEGNYEIASNNRPISLLPILSKVCEKVALNQLTEYLNKYNLLSPCQSGNKRNHSTETININTTDRILKSMDQKKLTALILIDLSKAFDSIDHSILLQKLKAVGVSLSALEWFQSFLTDRRQYVRIGSSTSNPLKITHGVPQGSMLSPLLFSIYTNDLPSATKECSLDSYVDDSKVSLSFSIQDISKAKLALEEDLNNVARWCCTNSLLLNPDKTKFILFGTPQLLGTLPEELTLNFLNKTLYPLFSVKDLGVTLDSHLKYDTHISELVSSCLSKLCQISRVRHLLDRETLSLIIHSLVLSKIFYCSVVWSNTAAKNVEKLQLVQNFAARIITGNSKFDHISPILQELGWMTVHKRLIYRDTLQIYKCLKDLSPQYLGKLFKLRACKCPPVSHQTNS